MRWFTLTLAVILSGGSLLVAVADGGNVDFYWKPMSLTWFGFTLYACISKQESKLIRIVRSAWWLQIIAPILFFMISIRLVAIYEPNPLRPHINKTEPNQALQTMTMLVTPAAAHPSRQAQSCLI
jgi:hypothetical protein